MLNIYPELATWRVNSQGKAAIIIRIDYNKNRLGSCTFDHKVSVCHWDKGKKALKDDNENAAYIGQLLKNRINEIENFFLKREALKLPINKKILDTFLKNGSSLDSFYSYAAGVIDTKELKDGRQLDKDSKRRYNDEIKRMMVYAPELSFNDINTDFLGRYKSWLQNTYRKKDGQKLHKNSIWKAMGFIRMILKEAIKAKIILAESYPFGEFKVGSFEKDISKIKYLEIDQVNKLETVLLNEQMEDMTRKVGWRFLVMCVSGLRISDAMKLDDYFFNDRGDLEFKPHKTRRFENVATIPVTTERQRRYLQRSLQDAFPPVDPKNFRTTFNIHLKILAAMSGIRINLTSHVGRHTMGGFLVDAGIETKPAMAILGIKSEEVIKTYLHLKQDKLRSEADKLGNVM